IYFLYAFCGKKYRPCGVSRDQTGTPLRSQVPQTKQGSRLDWIGSEGQRPSLLCVVVCCLQRCHVELHHLQHSFHHRMNLLWFIVVDQVHETPRDDLPGDAELIGDPAALRRGRAGTDQLVPVLVDLFLALAVDKERETLGECEVRATVVPHEGLTTDDEFGGSNWAVLASAGDAPDLRVRERSGVEFYCGLELVVEHQERCHFGHWCASSIRVFAYPDIIERFAIERFAAYGLYQGSYD